MSIIMHVVFSFQSANFDQCYLVLALSSCPGAALGSTAFQPDSRPLYTAQPLSLAPSSGANCRCATLGRSPFQPVPDTPVYRTFSFSFQKLPGAAPGPSAFQPY